MTGLGVCWYPGCNRPATIAPRLPGAEASCNMGFHQAIDRVVALGPCKTCGAVHQRCVAHLKATATGERRGEPCRKAALAGGVACRSHGGGAPQIRAENQRRLRRERALGEVGGLIADALDVVQAQAGTEQLMAAINRAGAMALAYQWLLEELPERSQWSWVETPAGEGPSTRWVTVQSEGLIGPDQHGVMQLHAYEEGLRHWTALHGRLLKAAADIGLEERKQRFREDQVRTVGDAIRGIVAGLGRELDDPEVVPVVTAALQLIAGETAA